MCRAVEADYAEAKRRAARDVVGRGRIERRQLPSKREIQEQIALIVEGKLAENEPAEGEDRRQADATDRQINDSRFHIYRLALMPLERIRQDPRSHPEGDLLYHSLQVFDLACEESPFDEDLLLAALLHEVGRAVDPRDAVRAGLDLLKGCISSRTAWFVAHLDEAQALLADRLSGRARRGIKQSEDFTDLMLLAECDLAGRAVGVNVPDVDEALDYVREVARTCGE